MEGEKEEYSHSHGCPETAAEGTERAPNLPGNSVSSNVNNQRSLHEKHLWEDVKHQIWNTAAGGKEHVPNLSGFRVTAVVFQQQHSTREQQVVKRDKPHGGLLREKQEHNIYITSMIRHHAMRQRNQIAFPHVYRNVSHHFCSTWSC